MIDYDTGRKTEQAHWDGVWKSPVRARIPSPLNVDVRHVGNLLRRHVRTGDRYLEIGCAPGKYLAFVAGRLGATVSGLDYSETGIRQCRALFDALALPIDLHQGDFFNHQLPLGNFDVVTSWGFIEHFDDPTDAVRRHIDLLRPGGVALIGVPNYAGLYGSLQRRVDPENLALHNLNIMTLDALLRLVEPSPSVEAKTYHFGRVSLWLVNLERRLPRTLALMLQIAANMIGHLQPFTVPALAPTLVLEIHKRQAE